MALNSKNNHKSKKFETSDFDIDSDLNIPDFDFDAPKIKDDRNAVTKVASATLKGAISSVLNPSIIRSTIRRSMPDEYGDAMNLFDETSSHIGSLYNNAVKEFRPAARDLKKAAQRVLPKTEGILPKKIQDTIKRWSSSSGDDDGYRFDAEAMRQSQLTLELGSIFKAQAEDTDRRAAETERRDQLNQSIEQLRHRDQLGMMDAVRGGIDRLVAYQDNVLANYQKKSLELQYRQYFATVDMLEHQRKAAEDAKVQLAGILKNTGLPEFVKVRESERFQEIARNKFMMDVRDSLFGDSSDYLRKLMSNLSRSVKGKISEYASSASQFGAMADLATSMPGGGDAASTIGGFAGGLLGDYGVEKGQDWLKGKIAGNRKLQKGAETLGYRMANAGQLTNDYFNDPDRNWGLFEGLRNFITDNLPSNSPETRLENDTTMKLNEPGVFTRAASKSIIEIIPGYLAHIQRELQIMRTGDEATGLSIYDYETNKFTTEKALGQRVRNKVAGKQEQELVDERLNEIMQMVDPQGQFNPMQKQALRKQLLNLSLRRRSTDAKVVSDAMTWRGAGAGASGIAQAFSSLLETDAEGNRSGSLEAIRNQRQLSDKIRGLTQGIADPRSELQTLVNLGQGEALKKAGILDERDGSISMDNLVQMLLGNYQEPGTPGATAQVGRGMGRRGKQGKTIVNQTYSNDNSDITQSLAELSESLRRNSTIEQVKLIAESVRQIEERLAHGLLVFGDTTGQYTGEVPEEFTGPAKPGLMDRGKQKVQSLRSWFDVQNMSVGEFLGRAGGALGGAVGLAGRTLTNTASRLTGLGLGTAKTLGAGLGRAAGAVADFVGDVYVKGELKPRLTRAKMLAGEYIDQSTGKVITSLRDIKGTIIDKDGNIVLDLAEIKDSFMKGKVVTALTEGIRRAGGMLGSLASGLSGLVADAAGGIYGVGFQVGKMAFAGLKKILPPFDVYVKGMDKPVLLAARMRMGSYFSEKTGQLIRHPRDIDGPVVDAEGNYILTDEEINQGLVDKNGLAVGNFVGRILRNVGGVAMKGLGMLRGLATSAQNVVMGVGRFFTDMFGGVFGLKGEWLQTSKSQLDVQLEILSLLQERLPPRQRLMGDVDGDGVREGSAADILRKRDQARRERTAAAQAGGGAQAGIMGSLLGGLKSMFGSKKEDKEEDDGDSYFFGGGGDKGRSPKGPPKVEPKATTALGRAGQIAKGGAKKAGGLLARLGGLGLGALGIGGGILGGIGSLAAGAGSLAMSGLAGLGGLLGGAATVIGGILTAPVALAALGITGAALAGYYGYKYLTKKRLQTLSRVRLVQYGFAPDDEDHAQGVFGLEDQLEPAVKLDGPTPSLDDKKIDLKKAMGLFGVDTENERQVANWLRWFDQRFKPIFLGHVAVLRSMAGDLRLSQVDDKLSAQDKVKYLNAASMPSGPYGALTSPFADLKRLVSDSYMVSSQLELARATLEKEAKASPAKTAVTAGAAAAATGALASTAPASDASNPQGLSTSLRDLEKGSIATVAEGGARMTVQSDLPSDYLFTGRSGQVEALSAIRYKAYGLTAMDADKIRALRYLELYVQKNLTFTGNQVNFDNDAEQILERVKGQFGISGARSPLGLLWLKWFRARFLPVFLNYATAVEKITRKKDVVAGELLLKPQDQISVANVIKSTSTTYEGRQMPVWLVDASPWRDYPLNTDEKSIDLNLEALTQAAKAVILGEHKSSAVRQEVANNQAVGDGAKPFLQADTAGGAALKYQNPVMGRDRYSAAASGSNSDPRSLNADGTGVRAAGDYVGGVAIKHPGAGTGGDINSIPDVKGSGWDNVKDTIMAAAKAVGIDPKLMSTIAAIESGFNPTIKAGTSSATGLFQFISSTWNGMLRKYGKKYGIAIGTPPTDARANALMGGEFLKENMDSLKQSIKRPLTATDLYIAHFLGPGGAKTFLNGDPNTIAASVMQKEAQANPTIFFDKNGRARTFGEIYNLFTKKINGALGKFGIAETEVAPAAATAAATTSASSGPTSGYGTSTGTAALSDVAQTYTKPAATADPSIGPQLPTAAPVTPPPVRTSPDFAGFQASARPSAMEQRAQDMAARSDVAVEVSSIGKTLLRSLDVQMQSLEVLRQMAGAGGMSMKPAAVAATAAVAANDVRQSTPREAPAAAVSMARDAF